MYYFIGYLIEEVLFYRLFERGGAILLGKYGGWGYYYLTMLEAGWSFNALTGYLDPRFFIGVALLSPQICL